MSVLEIRGLRAGVEDKEILERGQPDPAQRRNSCADGAQWFGQVDPGLCDGRPPALSGLRGRHSPGRREHPGDGADERCKAGLFLAFQYPVAVPGVSVANFLRTAVSNVRGYTAQAIEHDGRGGVIGSNLMPMREFRRELNDKMKEYNVDPSFARRYLNDGFSGGEKKRTEVLQMAMLGPKFAIMDESDSGLDIDALRVVSEASTSWPRGSAASC
jgi:Fe-S cluster assembly ATP-binding protein